jgi:hypothetical protein
MLRATSSLPVPFSELGHGVALADHLMLRVHSGAQREILGLEALLPERVADDEHRFLEREWLLDEIEGAHLDRAHRRLDVAVARDDDDLRVDLPFAHAGQRRETIHSGQPDVQDDDVVRLSGEPLEAGLATLGGVDVIAFVAQHATQRAAHAGLVVDNQDGGH